MNRRRMMMQQQNKGLPSGYTALKYITATETQYFDTGVYADGYTGARYKYSIAKKKIYGPYMLSGSGFFAFPFLRNNNIYINRGQTYTKVVDYKINTPYEFYVDENGDVFLDDNLMLSIGNITVDNANEATVKFGAYYGAINDYGNYGLKGDIYFCQIFQNGEIVRDFAPCVNPEGIAGMYDFVEGKFYRSERDDYIAGEVV